MKGRGITEEEFFFGDEGDIIRSISPTALREKVLSKKQIRIKAEADKRGVEPSKVEDEYWEAYVDGLIKKAKIEIVDPEMKELFEYSN